MKKLIIFTSLLLALLYSYNSFAASATRFSLLGFRPAPDGGEYFSVASSTSLYQLQWNVGMMADFAYKPLIEKGTSRDIIDRYLADHVYGAIGLTDWISVGFELPIVFLNHFSDPDVASAPFKNHFSLGDPRFQLKFRILDRAHYPVGIAIVPYGTAPLGKKDYFMGNDGLTGGGLVVVDTEIKRRLWLSLNVGAEGHKSVLWRNVDPNKISVLAGLGASFRATDSVYVSAEANVKSATNHFFNKKETTPAEAILGVKVNIGKTGLQVYAGGGAGIVRGVGGPTFRGFGGISYKSTNERTLSLDEQRVQEKYVTLKVEQEEISKVIALRDKCPRDPADYKVGVDDEGCPKYYELKEVADLIQKCPTNPENFDPAKHSEACQKVYTLADKYGRSDEEAIYAITSVELSEKCPRNPLDFNPKVHDEACPKFYELKDVSPLIAKCPSDPKKFNPNVDDEGCPKVYELKDTYSEENWMVIARIAKENQGSIVPKVAVNKGMVIQGNEIITPTPIIFKFNSYEITDESSLALGELSEQLIANPNIGIVRIEGYSDVIGPKVKSKIYSQKRAEAVKRYLELHGVNPGMLKVQYYGPTYKFGNLYFKNRRVIFILEK